MMMYRPAITCVFMLMAAGCSLFNPEAKDPPVDPPAVEARLFPTRVTRKVVLEEVTVNTTPPGSGRIDFFVSEDGINQSFLYRDQCTLVATGMDGSGRTNRAVFTGCETQPVDYIHRFVLEDRLFALSPSSQSPVMTVQVADLDGQILGRSELTLETTPQHLRVALMPDHSFVVLVGRGTFGYEDPGWRNQLAGFTADGQVRWSVLVPEPGDSLIQVTDIAPLPGGRFLALANRSDRFQPAVETRLYTFDADGRLQAAQTISSPEPGAFTEIRRLGTNRYLLAGKNQGGGAGHAWFREIDAAGTTIWDSEPLWDEWYKRYLYPYQEHFLLYARRRSDGDIELVARDTYIDAPEIHTYRVGAAGALLQEHPWPTQFTSIIASVPVPCSPVVMHPGPGGQIGVLATCMAVQRLGTFEWRSTIQTVLFEMD